MAGVASGVLPSPDLLDFELGAFDLSLDDFGGDGGAVNDRLTDGTGATTVGQQYPVKLNGLAWF